MLREIQNLVHRLARRGGHRARLDLDFRQVLLRDGVLQARLGERAGVEGEDVMDLVRQHARDLEAQAGHVAHEHRHLALPAQRQERAVVQQLHLPGKGGHLEDRLMVLGQDVATEGGHAFLQAHVEEAAGIGVEAEAVVRGVLLLGRNLRHAQALALGQHFLVDRLRIAPAVGPLGFALVVRIARRQEPQLEGLGDLLLRRASRELHDEDLLGLQARVVDDLDPRRADAEEVVHPRHPDLLFERLDERGAAARGLAALPGAQLDDGVLAGQGEGVRVHEGARLPLVVGDMRREIEAALFLVGGLEAHLDALLERRPVHRMAEAPFRHHLLEVRIHGVLVELGLAQTDGEGRGRELEVVLFEFHVAGHQSLAVEAHRELLAHRPVLARAQLQLAIRHPFPGALELGLHVDALLDHRAHRLERRHRGREHDRQRPRRRLVADGRERRFDDV